MCCDYSSVLCSVFLLISIIGRADGDQDLRNPAPDFSRHNIVRPVVLHGRTKREISSTRHKNEAHHPEITISFPIEGEEDYVFDLRLNQDLIPDNHILSYQDNGRNVLYKPKKEELDMCHYGGSVRDKPGSWVAVSTCHGVQGIVFDGERMRYIEPAQDGGLNSQHYIYDHSDVIDANLRKYVRNEVSRRPESHHMNHRMSRSKRSADGTIHEPFNANKDSHYVELALVTDSGVYEANNRDRNRIHHQMLVIANYINALFSPLNIFVALVGVEVWETDQITVHRNASKTLANFVPYRNGILNTKIPHDNAQLLVQEHFIGTTVGLGYVNTMCRTESCAVANNHTTNIGLLAMTMAHEMGHNFGMNHDENCECKEKWCIMNAYATFTTHWSSCSLRTLALRFSRVGDYYDSNKCLRNKPKHLYDSPTCGNGFVESGEQCDCGTMAVAGAYNPCHACCDPNTCMLRANATCGAGMCCDLQTCQVKSSGTICRAAQECDLPEYCDGYSEYCPDDVYVMDATRCKAQGKMCINKQCVYPDSFFHLRPKPVTCPSDCSGRGVCNSKGHCHCDPGYGPPNCAVPGPGGSYDSGPATDTTSTDLPNIWNNNQNDNKNKKLPKNRNKNKTNSPNNSIPKNPPNHWTNDIPNNRNNNVPKNRNSNTHNNRNKIIPDNNRNNDPPINRNNNLPDDKNKNIPNNRNKIIPGNRNNYVPNNRNKIIPDGRNTNVPNNWNNDPPYNRNNNLPDNTNKNIPNNRNKIIPGNRNNYVPNNRNKIIPDGRNTNVPNNWNNDPPNNRNYNIPDKRNNNTPNHWNNDTPNKRNNNIPNNRNNNIPSNRNNNIPSNRNNNVPNNRNNNVPNNGNNNIPTNWNNNLPYNRSNNIPNNRNNNIPNNRNNNIPSNRNNNIPSNRNNNVPNNRNNNVPNNGNNNIPTNWNNNLPYNRSNNIPNNRNNNIPNNRNNNIPSNRNNNIPSNRNNKVPNNRNNNVPNNGNNNIPTNWNNNLPYNRSNNIPNNRNNNIPNNRNNNIPFNRNNNIPTNRYNNIPSNRNNNIPNNRNNKTPDNRNNKTSDNRNNRTPDNRNNIIPNNSNNNLPDNKKQNQPVARSRSFMIAMYAIFLGIVPAILVVILIFISRHNILQRYKDYYQRRLSAKSTQPPRDPPNDGSTGAACNSPLYSNLENIDHHQSSTKIISLPIQNIRNLPPPKPDGNINKDQTDITGKRYLRPAPAIAKTTPNDPNVQTMSNEKTKAAESTNKNRFTKPSSQTKPTVNDSTDENDFKKTLSSVKLKPIGINLLYENVPSDGKMPIKPASKLSNEKPNTAKLTNENERKKVKQTMKSKPYGKISSTENAASKPPIKNKPSVNELSNEKPSSSSVSNVNKPEAKPSIKVKPNVINLSKENTNVNISNDNSRKVKPPMKPKPNVSNLSRENEPKPGTVKDLVERMTNSQHDRSNTNIRHNVQPK